MSKEQDKILSAVQTAIRMEIDGKEFYLKSSAASSNETGKKLFQSLAAEEDTHRKKFVEIYEAVKTKNEWPAVAIHPDGGKKLQGILNSISGGGKGDGKAGKSELDAIQTAMTLENKTYDFYKKQSDTAAYGSEKEFYLTLAAEERGHEKVLQEYYDYIKDPADWLSRKERASLDG